MDRLNAKLLAAVGEHDAAELWRNDGATSMTAWLRHHTRRAGRDAARCAKTARRLWQLPVTAGAYRDGVLSGGQVQAIVAHLTGRTVGRFARHETQLVPELARLSVHDTSIAMQDWARRAHAVVGDDPEPVLPERSLHRSRILDGRRELSGSFDPEGRRRHRHRPAPRPRPAMWTANPPVAPPSDAPTPSSTSAAEAHHLRWITHRGRTALDNLVLLSSRHHHHLHSPGWHAKLLPDTTLKVTDPQGHTSDPPALRPPLPLRE
jgi:hypothetical protein